MTVFPHTLTCYQASPRLYRDVDDDTCCCNQGPSHDLLHPVLTQTHTCEAGQHGCGEPCLLILQKSAPEAFAWPEVRKRRGSCRPVSRLSSLSPEVFSSFVVPTGPYLLYPGRVCGTFTLLGELQWGQGSSQHLM